MDTEMANEVADLLWDAMAERGLVDGRGGAEYRRVRRSRAWSTLLVGIRSVSAEANTPPPARESEVEDE